MLSFPAFATNDVRLFDTRSPSANMSRVSGTKKGLLRSLWTTFAHARFQKGMGKAFGFCLLVFSRGRRNEAPWQYIGGYGIPYALIVD